MASSLDALIDVIRILNELEIPHMLTGSFAANFYSYPRATKDADIVISYTDGDLGRIKERLSDDYVLDMQTSFETITGSLRNTITHLPSKFDIELFRLTDDEHHQERFRRRRQVELADLEVTASIPSPEDVIIQKLRWAREKDVDDARKVLQLQIDKLDLKYLNQWTEQHKTLPLLNKLVSEIKP